MLQPPEPILVVERFPEILNSLIQLLNLLEPEDWGKPTVCEGWSVKDVALHLLGIEIGNLSSRRDGYWNGKSLSSWDELVAFINQWNQEWVEVSRRISAPLLIDLLHFTGRQMCEYFQSLDPYAIGGTVSWAGPEPQPVWLDIAREYTERWHHQQHIRDAVDMPGLTQPQYLTPVISAFAWALPQTFRNTEAADGTIITMTIQGESGGQWSIRMEDGAWRFYQGAPDLSDAEVLLPEDIAWRLFTRGISKETVQQYIAIIGDSQLGAPIHDMVSIIA
jgi:uncharacterized protein (TIGR03083 family)